MNVTTTLLGAADQLGAGARVLASAGDDGATGAVLQTRRLSAAADLHQGAEGVRGLGGPFFERLAAQIDSAADSAAEGVNITRAIEVGLEGQRWLLGRHLYTAGRG